MVVGQRNSHSSYCIFIHRKYCILYTSVHLYFYIHLRLIVSLHTHRVYSMFLNSFSLYCTCFKLLYIEMSSVMLSRVDPGKFFKFLSSLCCVQHSNSHTRTFNVLMPVGLHLMTMQIQVPRISILHVVDPVEHSRVSGEPPCIPEDSIILCTQFCSIRMLRGLSPHPSQYIRGFIDRQSVIQF